MSASCDHDETSSASQPVEGSTDTIVEEPSSKSTQEDTASQEKEKSPHYLKRSRIWSQKEYAWVDYDPSQHKPPPPRCDLENYFYVDVRYSYKNPLDPPELILTHFSPILISFLRAYIGDEFFEKDPEYKLRHFFRKLKDLHSQYNAVKDACDLADADADQRRKLARKLGAKDADYGHLGDEHIIRYLSDIAEHASVLLDYIDEEFKPTADRLKLLVSYDQIDYDLLIYYFEKGAKVLADEMDDFGPTGQKIAVTVQSTYYNAGDNPGFYIKGRGVYWGGSAYLWSKTVHKLPVFKGTMQLEDLACTLLTSEMESELQERGRLYASYSGMHYMAYEDRKVIVDRRAYENQEGYVADPDAEKPPISDDLLYLLQPRVYGFDLTRKKWSSFLVRKLSPVVFDEGAWDHLVLDPDTKTLIKGLVDVTKNANSTKQIISDVISGKGGGLIAVLHGPPGTGKTLTAEAVAEYLKRPLYMVGSSELPSESSLLERSLRSILKLATAWDAVLLIDEADVYLERRSLHELSRNALVSVALRVLEYHRGVLFLTTNRIKNFDDAFLSRFSIGIKYPELDQSARRHVWQKFFELAKVPIQHVAVDDGNGHAFTAEDLDELSIKPFNGRTIKNLVRTAQALALASKEPLSMDHVRTVVRASEKFLDEFANADV